jgi:hypothetical protein
MFRYIPYAISLRHSRSLPRRIPTLGVSRFAIFRPGYTPMSGRAEGTVTPAELIPCIAMSAPPKLVVPLTFFPNMARVTGRADGGATGGDKRRA